MHKRGKRDQLADILYSFGALQTIHTVQRGSFICLSYHRIRRDSTAHSPQDSFRFCDAVFGPTASQFAEQIQWIKKNAHPLSQEELIHHVETETPLPPRSVMVTFDDGYSDNYTLAYPILKSYRVPAIYFIPTKIIGDRALGWWDIIAYLVKESQQSSISVGLKTYPMHSDPKQRRTTIHGLQQVVKLLRNDLTSEFLSDLAIACEVDLPSTEVQSQEVMTWDEIKEVSRNGITIGSHTHTHRVLSTLPLSEQIKELEESKEILEAKLDEPISSFAIPVGGYEHFSTETIDLVKQAGYKLCFSYLTGINALQRTNPYDVKRLSVPSEISRFVGMLAIPGFFAESACALKAPQSIRRQECGSVP